MTSPPVAPPAYTPSSTGTLGVSRSPAAPHVDAASQPHLGIRIDPLIFAARREYELTQNPANWGTRRTHRYYNDAPELQPETESWLIRLARLMSPPPLVGGMPPIGLLYF